MLDRFRSTRRRVFCSAALCAPRHADGLNVGGWVSSFARCHHVRLAGAPFRRLLVAGERRIDRYTLAFGISLGTGACAHEARAFRIDVLINYLP